MIHGLKHDAGCAVVVVTEESVEPHPAALRATVAAFLAAGAREQSTGNGWRLLVRNPPP